MGKVPIKALAAALPVAVAIDNRHRLLRVLSGYPVNTARLGNNFISSFGRYVKQLAGISGLQTGMHFRMNLRQDKEACYGPYL
jgi:hypothetical protein